MIGILTKNAVLLLDAGCINLLEYIFIDVAFMICRKKIKQVRWEQQTLIEFYRILFEGNGHG
jgi:hypothetical protein